MESKHVASFQFFCYPMTIIVLYAVGIMFTPQILLLCWLAAEMIGSSANCQYRAFAAPAARFTKTHDLSIKCCISWEHPGLDSATFDTAIAREAWSGGNPANTFNKKDIIPKLSQRYDLTLILRHRKIANFVLYCDCVCLCSCRSDDWCKLRYIRSDRWLTAML